MNNALGLITGRRCVAMSITTKIDNMALVRDKMEIIRIYEFISALNMMRNIENTMHLFLLSKSTITYEK